MEPLFQSKFLSLPSYFFLRKGLFLMYGSYTFLFPPVDSTSPLQEIRSDSFDLISTNIFWFKIRWNLVDVWICRDFAKWWKYHIEIHTKFQIYQIIMCINFIYFIWFGLFHKVFWRQKIIAWFQRKTINVEQEKKAECIDYCSRPVRLKTQTCESEPFPTFITTPVTTR